jgi:hypothetical protein
LYDNEIGVTMEQNFQTATISKTDSLESLKAEIETAKKKSGSQNIFTSRYASILVTVSLLFSLFGISFVIAYNHINKPKPAESYEQCIKSKGSVIRETYPAICVSEEGKEFIQPLSSEEQKLLEVEN